MKYELLLDQISEAFQKILKDNFVGFYVHGSIALQCFNWNKSDIDFIVVVNEKLSHNTKRQLMDAVMKYNVSAPVKGLEMHIVLKEVCTNFIYPTPFELHYSNAHKDWYKKDPEDYCNRMNGEDPDLAANFTIIKNCGITWCGRPIDDVFVTIPKDDFLDSIKKDVTYALDNMSDNPMYSVLNLCRVLAFIKNGLVLSKEQGGRWGMENLDTKYHNIIKYALECYGSDDKMQTDKEKLEEFGGYVTSKIFMRE